MAGRIFLLNDRAELVAMQQAGEPISDDEMIAMVFLLLVFLLLLIIPSLFPQANIIERLVLPPVEWISGHYMALARLVAGT